MNPGQTSPKDGRQADAINNKSQLPGGEDIENNLDNAVFGLLRVWKRATSCSTHLKGVSPLSSPYCSPLPALWPWVASVSSGGHAHCPLCRCRLLVTPVPVEVQHVQMNYHQSCHYFSFSPAGFLAIDWADFPPQG